MKAMVLLSGGLDSTTLLAVAVKKYGSSNVIALSISYGQKHIREVKASEDTAAYYNVEHLKLNLTPVFQFSNCSLLTNSTEEIPKETYAEQLKKTNSAPVSTYVPFRNGLFLSSAAAMALSKNCSKIYYGAHKDDAAGNAYPDCSKQFAEYMGKAIYEGSGGLLTLEAPFINMSKWEIVKTGTSLLVPYELTWSCYEGKTKPCGICGTCRDRAAAFAKNGLTDPLLKEMS